jgi:hypothetical protein
MGAGVCEPLDDDKLDVVRCIREALLEVGVAAAITSMNFIAMSRPSPVRLRAPAA